MPKFVLASGYYDMDDVTVYGPFDSYEDAMAAVPADFPEGTEWRAFPINPVEQIVLDQSEDEVEDLDDVSGGQASEPRPDGGSFGAFRRRPR